MLLLGEGDLLLPVGIGRDAVVLYDIRCNASDVFYEGRQVKYGMKEGGRRGRGQGTLYCGPEKRNHIPCGRLAEGIGGARASALALLPQAPGLWCGFHNGRDGTSANGTESCAAVGHVMYLWRRQPTNQFIGCI